MRRGGRRTSSPQTIVRCRSPAMAGSYMPRFIVSPAGEKCAVGARPPWTAGVQITQEQLSAAIAGDLLSALHRLEELRIGLGVLQFVQQELDRGEFVHRMQHFSEHPHFLQFVRLSQIFFLSRA